MPTIDSSNHRAAAQSRTGVASPCVSVCEMNPGTGLCAGCLRTIDEIAGWSAMDDAGKRAVWAQLKLRRSALKSGRR